MTEDCKLGLDLAPNSGRETKIVDDAATINLFEQADMGKLVHMSREATSFDDGGFDMVEADVFDDATFF